MFYYLLGIFEASIISLSSVITAYYTIQSYYESEFNRKEKLKKFYQRESQMIN